MPARGLGLGLALGLALRLRPGRTVAPLALGLALLLAGCLGNGTDNGNGDGGEGERTTTVEAPAAGGAWAQCPPTSSIGLAHPLRSEVWDEPRAEGIHRLDARTFHWVWRNYTDDLHEDRLTRVNPVELARDAEGTLHLCTRADLSTPTLVDDEPRTYAVGLRIQADADLPPGPIRVTVNWAAGCPCDPLPRGNVTARFE